MNSQQTSVENRLENAFSLAHFVIIVLPSTFEVDGLADTVHLENVTDHVLSAMSERFGGATTIDGKGWWLSGVLSGLVRENVTIAISFAHSLENDDHALVIDLAEHVKKELRQESVLIVLDGKGWLV